MEKKQPRENMGIRDQTAAESMAPSCTMQHVAGAGGLMGFQSRAMGPSCCMCSI